MKKRVKEKKSRQKNKGEYRAYQENQLNILNSIESRMETNKKPKLVKDNKERRAEYELETIKIAERRNRDEEGLICQ